MKIKWPLATAYMAGWRAGYHNATLAERKRINLLLKNLINQKGKNENRTTEDS